MTREVLIPMAPAVCGEQDGKRKAAAAGGIFSLVVQGDVV